MNYLHKCLAYPGQNNFFFSASTDYCPVETMLRRTTEFQTEHQIKLFF